MFPIHDLLSSVVDRLIDFIERNHKCGPCVLTLPQVPEFQPPLTLEKESGFDKPLQVKMNIANFKLTSENLIYSGGNWLVVRMRNV